MQLSTSKGMALVESYKGTEESKNVNKPVNQHVDRQILIKILLHSIYWDLGFNG